MEEELAIDPLTTPMMEQRADPPLTEFPPVPMGSPRRPTASPAPLPGAQINQPPLQAPAGGLRLKPQQPNQMVTQPSALPPPSQALNPLPPGQITPGVVDPRTRAPVSPLQQDEPDEASFARAQGQEDERYGITLSHKAPHNRIEDIELPDPRNSEEYRKLIMMKEALGGNMTDKERRPRQAIYQREVDRFMRTQKANEDRILREHRDKERAELRGLDEKWETQKARDETADNIQKYIGILQTTLTEQVAGENLNDARKASFRLAVGPIGTLKDGLHEVVRSIGSTNHTLSTEQATNYALAIGSPVGRDPADDPPMNGIKGKGGTNYAVVGRDASDAYLLRMPDGEIIRVKPVVKRALDAARLKGWNSMLQWEAERNKPPEPGLPDRIYNYFVPPTPKAK